jgi:hypothetical protein
MDQTASTALVIIDDDDEDAGRKEWEKLQHAMGLVMSELSQLATEAVQRRGGTEQRWLEDLRQFHGIYEADVLSALKDDDSRSRIFINITRPKTNAWIARMGDMLFPNDERNWGIDPTPVPQLTRQARDLAHEAEEMERQAQGLVDEHNASVNEAGGPIESDAPGQAQQLLTNAKALRDQERKQQAEIEYARRASQAMQRLIDDQLTESNYPARCRDVIEDLCKVGTGILKGPIVNDRPRRGWTPVVVDGKVSRTQYELKADDDRTPKFRRVDYWHFFPDPSASNMEECEYTFERHLPNKKMLRRMARDMDFYPHAVARLIKEGVSAQGASGDPSLNYVAELQAMESAGGTADGVSLLRDRYHLWEYHGPLEAEHIVIMLRANGKFKEAERIEKGTALEVPMVRVFFCGTTLLKIDPDYILDSGASLYSVATFEKGEATILGGIGVPRLMRHEQTMLNSAIRMMMDNAALAVGPQVVIDKESVAPENGRWKLTPRKVWQWVRKAGGDQRKENPFQTFDIPMNQEMLAAIVQLAVRFVDEAVAMPLIAQGEMGAHTTQTAGGMSMLFNSANVVFRRVVKNWDDDLTTGTVSRVYDFNMQFSEREDVKGDMKVEARGTSVLLVREIQTEQLMAIIREWSVHPILGVGFRAYHAMRLVLQAMSINPEDLLLPEEDYLQKLKAMSEQSAPDSPEAIRAQSALEVAQIDAKSRLDVAGVNMQIAQLRAQQAMAELASNREISLEQINAMFKKGVFDVSAKAGIEKEKIASSERSLAAEIAMEREAARRAEARGLEPTGSGGAISMGAREPGSPQ